MLNAWTKLNRSFSGLLGWRQTCPRRQQRKHRRLGKAARVAERKLVHVILEILPADAVVRSVNGTLHLTPKAVNRVRVDSPANVFLLPVVDDFVFESQFPNVIVNRIFIGVNRRSLFDVGTDQFDGVDGRNAVHHLRHNAASALHDADYRSLIQRSSSTLTLSNPANVGFIGFDFTAKQGMASIHERTDLMADSPRAFVSHAKLSLQFFRGNSVAALGEQEHGKEPRLEARRGFVKHRASRRVNLRSAERALVGTTFGTPMEAVTLPAFADVVGIASFPDELQTGGVIGELCVKLFEVELRLSRILCRVHSSIPHYRIHAQGTHQSSNDERKHNHITYLLAPAYSQRLCRDVQKSKPLASWDSRPSHRRSCEPLWCVVEFGQWPSRLLSADGHVEVVLVGSQFCSAGDYCTKFVVQGASAFIVIEDTVEGIQFSVKFYGDREQVGRSGHESGVCVIKFGIVRSLGKDFDGLRADLPAVINDTTFRQQFRFPRAGGKFGSHNSEHPSVVFSGSLKSFEKELRISDVQGDYLILATFGLIEGDGYVVKILTNYDVSESEGFDSGIAASKGSFDCLVSHFVCLSLTSENRSVGCNSLLRPQIITLRNYVNTLFMKYIYGVSRDTRLPL